MSNEDEVLGILRQAGAVRDGHFLLTSGLHSPTYVEKFQVLQWPDQTEKLCKMIADHYRDAGVQVVAGPTTGGIIIAYEVARQLGVRSIFAEREGATSAADSAKREVRRFRRGFDIAPGERVLVVDDILTTGGSIQAVLDEVARHKGQVVGVAVLVERAARPVVTRRDHGHAQAHSTSTMGVTIDFGVPLFSLLKLDIPAYAPGECSLCAAGTPLVKPGSGKPNS
ncbi:MAG: orotate phosphoribosyltransferase [Bacteroidetes bacterium]|nr:orotate phosphoribosyltransferase [Bacteroidota bacterium]MCL5025099.1 orotate phosphoribosyltransferase [Chloroflexota bacterium]